MPKKSRYASTSTARKVVTGLSVEPDVMAIIKQIAADRDQSVSSALHDLVYFACLPALVADMAGDENVPLEKKIEASEAAREKYTRWLAGVLPNLQLAQQQIQNLTSLNAELRRELEAINAKRAAGVEA